MDLKVKSSKLNTVVKVAKWTGISLVSLVLIISATLYMMRDKIIGVVVTEVNKTLNTPVQVGDLSLTFWSSFPNLSVDFNKVFIQDALPTATKKDTLFYSDRIRLKLNPFDVLQKRYIVKAIEVFPGKGNIKISEDGQVNYNIVKSDSSNASSNFNFALNKVIFNDFLLGYWNDQTKQDYSVKLTETELIGNFSAKKTSLQLVSKNNIQYLKSEGVKLIQNTTSEFSVLVFLDTENDNVFIPKTKVLIGDLPFEFAMNSTNRDLKFILSSDGLKIADLVNHLNHKSTSSIREIKGSGQLDFKVNYFQKVERRPQIDASFRISNGSVVEPGKNQPLDNIQLAGRYSNHDRTFGDLLDLKKLSFRTNAGTFSGKLRLTEFDNPHFVGEANGRVDLAILHSIFQLPTIESTKGIVDIDGKFDIQKTDGHTSLDNCSAYFKFHEVQIKQLEDKRLYDHINGQLSLDGTVAVAEHLSLTIGKSDVSVKGEVSNLEEFFSNRGLLEVNAQISSAYLDVQDFSSSSKKEEIANGRNYILPDNIHGSVRLLSNQLVYENHNFKNLRCDLSIGNRVLEFNNLALNNAEADILGTAKIAENSPEIFTIESNVSTKKLAFQPLFKEWNNFEQEVLTANQISGFAEVDLQFKAPFDLRSGVRKKDIVAAVHLKVREGKLTNVLAFKEITESLKSSKATRLILKQNNIQSFENELLNLRFANFDNTLYIQNGRITIPQMHIASNAIDVDLSGTHDFDNQVDYRLSFNFRDIRKHAQMTEFGEVVDDGSGLQLFVHMFGPLASPTIKWDHEAQKLMVKENFEAEKQTAKSILKTELGLFKKDSTITAYAEKPKLKEQIIITAAADKNNPEPVLQKKENKLSKTFNKWKDQAENEKDGKVVVETHR